MATGWELVADVRRAFADMVAALDADQAASPTLCGGWTAHHVTAHVASFVEVPLHRFFWNIARHRFDYDAAADSAARSLAERPIAELAGAIRARAAKPSRLPIFPAEMTATDVAVHTQDIRRPLALAGELPAATLVTALTFMTTHKMAARTFVDVSRFAGVELVATDLEWRHGSGPMVSGPAEALMMAVAGRPVHAELSGPGVATMVQGPG